MGNCAPLAHVPAKQPELLNAGVARLRRVTLLFDGTSDGTFQNGAYKNRSISLKKKFFQCGSRYRIESDFPSTNGGQFE